MALNPAVKLRSSLGNHWQTPLLVKETDTGEPPPPDSDIPPGRFKSVTISYETFSQPSSGPCIEMNKPSYDAIVAYMNDMLDATPYPELPPGTPWFQDYFGQYADSYRRVITLATNYGPWVITAPAIHGDASGFGGCSATGAMRIPVPAGSWYHYHAAGGFYWCRCFLLGKAKFRARLGDENKNSTIVETRYEGISSGIWQMPNAMVFRETTEEAGRFIERTSPLRTALPPISSGQPSNYLDEFAIYPHGVQP